MDRSQLLKGVARPRTYDVPMEQQTNSSFDELIGASDPALLVVTTAVDGRLAGCVVGFHSQSSMLPERYCFWLSKANETYLFALRADHFVAHFLTAEDGHLAELFGARSGKTVDKFAAVEYSLNAYGVPLLAALPNRLELQRIALLDSGGDHVCVESRMLTAASTGSFTPLRDSAAQHLEPGRRPQEPAVNP